MALTLQQLKDRKHGIGGSDAAAILGLSKWKTPLDIFFDKTSEEVNEDEKLSSSQEWGNILEPVIINKFEKETGLTCVIKNEKIIHPKHNFMLSNIDAFIPSENAILECKTADKMLASEWSLEGGDNIPDYYLIQCAHYAEVMNVKKVYIAVLIGGNDFRIYHYNANQQLQDVIVQKEEKFWNENVLKRIPPQPLSYQDCQNLWKQSKNIVIESNQDIEEAFYKLKSLKEEIQSKEKEVESLQKDICSFMGEADTLITNNSEKLCTWKSQSAKRIDTNLLKVQNPEIYDKYLKESSFRVFRLNK